VLKDRVAVLVRRQSHSEPPGAASKVAVVHGYREASTLVKVAQQAKSDTLQVLCFLKRSV